jgi:acyl-CoA hydrolase
MFEVKYTTAQEALKVLKPGNNVFIQTASAAPQQLIKAMVESTDSLSNASIYHMHTEGATPYAKPKYKDIFNAHCFFIAANMREAVNVGNADYMFLSEIPALFPLIRNI